MAIFSYKALLAGILSIMLTNHTYAAMPDWQPATSYTNSTTAYGIVTVDGQPANEGSIVGVFVGTECRGATTVILDSGIAYMNIQIAGDVVNEIATFLIYDPLGDLILEVANSYFTEPGYSIGLPPNYLDINGYSPTLKPISIIISCPNSVEEGSIANCTAMVTMDDNSTKEVTGSAEWSENSIYAEMNLPGVMTTSSVPSDQVVTIFATHTENNITVSDHVAITIKNSNLILLFLPAILTGTISAKNF